MEYFRKAKGFTLAEVLIVLGIIGVIAAFTIPTLINSYQEKVVVTKVKKFYSLMNQAVALAKLENGDVDTWADADADYAIASNNYAKILEKSLKFTKKCYSEANSGCIPNSYITPDRTFM